MKKKVCVCGGGRGEGAIRASTNLVMTITRNSHPNTNSKRNVKQIWKCPSLN